MAGFTKIAAVKDIPPGTKKSFFSSGKRIMIANADGHFFATDDACTHAGCSLAQEGSVAGATVTCHCHGSQFSLEDGSVLNPPASVPLHVYKTKVDGDAILIEL